MTDEVHYTNHDQRNHTQASHVRTVRKRQRQRDQNNGYDVPSKRDSTKHSPPLEHG